MKKGLIVKNTFNKSETYLYQLNRIKEEMEILGIKIDIKDTASLHLLIDDSIKFKSENDYDFVIFLDKDIVFSLMLEKLGYKVINSSRAIEICDNKFLTHLYLANENIKMPKTIPGLLCYSYSNDIDLNYIDYIVKELGFPMVFKLSYGSLGKNVFLINDKNELVEYVKKYKHDSFIFQKYIKESYGKDLRIILVGNKVVGTMLRKNDNDFRSNIGFGGKGYKFVPEQKYLDIAIKASKVLKLDYCGIDVLFGENNEPILCEVNSNAFFEEFENVNNINVAKIYAEYIINLVYNNK